jgi:hypothetical protein
MRYRTGVLALVALLAAAAAPPRADAAPASTTPTAITMPVLQDSVHVAVAAAGPIAAAESLHVYVLTQLAMSDSLGRDSTAVRELASRALSTLVAAFVQNDIPIYRVTAYVRASQPLYKPSSDRTPPDTLPRRVAVLRR